MSGTCEVQVVMRCGADSEVTLLASEGGEIRGLLLVRAENEGAFQALVEKIAQLAGQSR